MTKLWFRTKNDQIVDLNDFSGIYIEVFSGMFRVFASHVSDCDNVYTMASFADRKEAQAYLDEIYKLLTINQPTDVLYRCDECKKYPPLIKTDKWPYFETSNHEDTINCSTCKNETIACSCMENHD